MIKVSNNQKQPSERRETTNSRNWYDGLSHHWKASITMGKLVPFLMLPTIPNDFFKINVQLMQRFAPLYLPIFHYVSVSMDYWFVPSRITWNTNSADDSWENFVMNKQELLMPFVDYNADQLAGTDYELGSYMGLPQILEDQGVNTDYHINVNALPLVAYYMIYDQGYRNDQLQNPINAQEDVISGTGGATGFTNADAAALRCMYRNWNKDLFTVSTAEPQQGAPVQIPLVSDSFINGVGVEGVGPSVWQFADGTNPTDGALNTTLAGTPAGAYTTRGGSAVYLDVQATAASIAQFRFASVYQEYLERLMRTGDKISDYYPNFWSTDPYNGTLQLPQFLGSKQGRVVISEVMSTTETDTLKVGNYAGQALTLESSNNTIEYHCQEHGYIIGIISVYPDSSYFQGLERIWTQSTYLDLPDPRFALIGDEEVKNKEVQYQYLTSGVGLAWNNEVFGYRERFLDSRFKNDVVAGLLRTSLISFHLGRIFDPSQYVALNDEFLLCKPRVTDVFQVALGEDEIYCHIYNEILVQRMLPKFGIPNL